MAIAWSVLIVGLLLVGGGIGYLLQPPASDAPVVLPDSAVAPLANAGDMPDVVGLNINEAQAAIGDAGITGVEFTRTERPGAGPPGTVLDQQPQVGLRPEGTVEFVVSTPVQMPDVLGRPEGEVRSQLEDLGAVVNTERVVEPLEAAGSVINATTPRGDDIPSVVILTVAEPGDALSLSTVSSVDSSSCSTSSSNSVKGVTLSNNIVCRPGSSPATADYAINRNVTLFEATLGTDDREGTGGATVTIYGDGRPIKTVRVSLGRSERVQIDVRDVMRLGFQVTTADRDQAPDVVIGDATLRGSTEGLDQVAGR